MLCCVLCTEPACFQGIVGDVLVVMAEQLFEKSERDIAFAVSA